MKNFMHLLVGIIIGFGQTALAYDDSMKSRNAEILCSQVEGRARYSVALVKSSSAASGYDLYVVVSGPIAEYPGAETKVFEGPALVSRNLDQVYFQDLNGVIRVSVGYMEGRLSIHSAETLHNVKDSFMLCLNNKTLFFHEPKSPAPRISIGN